MKKINQKLGNIANKQIHVDIHTIGIVLLCIIIVMFNLVIGGNQHPLDVLPITISLILIIIYLIVLKIKNRQESIFFKNRIDYFVLAFMLTTTLPLIFKTYASYSDTIEFIMKYFFIYSVYILARNTIKNKKQIEIIIVTTLIFSLIPTACHLKYLGPKAIKLFDILGLGILDYDNAQAIYSCFCIFLAMHRFKVNKSKILKCIDILFILFSLYVIYIKDGRVIMILLAIILFALFIAKFRKQIVTHKVKIFVGLGIFAIILAGYLSIALNTPEQIVKINENVKEYIFYRFKQNDTYTLELDLETECLNKDIENTELKVTISQGGKYFVETIIANGVYIPKNNNFKIQFTPTQDTQYIKLCIFNNNYITIRINNCYIDGKRIIAKYKYIPTNIGILLNGFFIKGNSLPQRLYMYKDSLKIAKDSPIIGSGGNTWKNVSKSVQEYNQAWKESHSYFFETLISYGIIGVIALLTLVIYFFVKIFKQCIRDKEKRKEKLLIVLGLFVLLFYNITFDFGMSFLILQLMVYIYMAVLLRDEQEKVLKPKVLEKLDYILLIFLVFILSLYIKNDICTYRLVENSEKHAVVPYKKIYYFPKIEDDIKNNKDKKEILKDLKDYMNNESYYMQTATNQYYFNTINKAIENLSNDELNEYLQFGINRLKTVRFETPLSFDKVLKRTQIIVDFVNNLNNYLQDKTKIKDEERINILNNAINELKDIIKKEYEINKANIEDYERHGVRENARKNLIEKYQKIIGTISDMEC